MNLFRKVKVDIAPEIVLEKALEELTEEEVFHIIKNTVEREEAKRKWYANLDLTSSVKRNLAFFRDYLAKQQGNP